MKKKNRALLKVSLMQKKFGGAGGAKVSYFYLKCILLNSLLSLDHSAFETKSTDFNYYMWNVFSTAH